MSIAKRVVSIAASSKYLRRLGVGFYSLSGSLSSKIGLNPVIVVPLDHMGIDGKFTLHPLNRDLAILLEVFVLKVYDKFCVIRPGETIIDCGAHIGAFAVHASKRVGTEGLVLAFEPNPITYRLCQRNLANNHASSAIVFNYALGEREGSGFIEIDKANLGASRVVNEKGKTSSPTIPIRALVQFLPYFQDKPVKLLKVDVEGYAIRVLMGARDLLRKGVVENVAVEIHRGEQGLQDLLESYGFACKQEGAYLYGSFSRPNSVEPGDSRAK